MVETREARRDQAAAVGAAGNLAHISSLARMEERKLATIIRSLLSMESTDQSVSIAMAMLQG
jgi:hypothetical protein